MKITAKHPLYARWRNMINFAYGDYAEKWRAIGATVPVVCDRWLGSGFEDEGFANFIADVGLPPAKNAVLRRKDLRAGWEPSNMEWSTRRAVYRDNHNRVIGWRNWVPPEVAEKVDRILEERAHAVADTVEI